MSLASHSYFMPGYFDRCNRGPDCPPGCNCAAFERFQESDEFPAWQLEQLELGDEINPPTEPTINAAVCAGRTRCEELVDAPGDWCHRCQAEENDARAAAAFDAMQELS